MKSLLILFALIFPCTFCTADEKVPPKAIEVTGTSDVNVVPDKAIIDIGVEKQNPSAAAAKKAADSSARELLAALRANGIDDKDVTTNWLSLSPQYDWHSGKMTYFIADQSLTVTVHDLSKLDNLLDLLIKAGGNRINSIQFETSDIRKYRDQARELAVGAAREKAEALAKALGQSIGKAIAVEEVPQATGLYGYNGLLANTTLEVSDNKARSGPAIAAGQRKVTASVTVWFELQ